MESRSPRRHRGAALIITLAMIAMMTFLVVAFFSRSLTNLQVEAASTGTVRADLLARSACGIVVGDFRTEIIAGSTASGSSAQAPVYVPKTAAAAAPALSRLAFATGYDDKPFVNLVKQSCGRFFLNVAPYNTNPNAQPVIQAVTNVSTDMASANGRMVVSDRWDYPASTSPLGPVLCVGDLGYSHFYSTSMQPHWIMMTRDGIPAGQAWTNTWKNYSPDNANAAIGRFAYNIYDVGGLLDANVAGYDEVTGSSTSPALTVVGQKGTLGLAKLSVLPGMGSSETNAANFAKNWRNAASGGTANDYLAYLGLSKNGTVDITNSPFFLAGTKTGFTKAAAGTTSADNRVLGRQDLIRLAAKSGAPYGLNLTTLPYLTHFSRETNAPSWYPALNAGPDAANTPNMGGNNGTGVPAPYAYYTNRDNSAVPNRALTNVRAVVSGGGWTRLTGEAAVNGEPLIKYRFPLSWLALLQDDNPSNTDWDLSNEAKAIVNNLNDRNSANGGGGLPGNTINERAAYLVRRAFGLAWNSGEYRWDYVGSSAGTTIQRSIELLGDASSSAATVCRENREPNFFELLKAGILSGSLGNASDLESMCANIGEDQNPDYQVIQIGANIIDQADADSYPTRIAFAYEMESPATSLLNPPTGNTVMNPATPGSNAIVPANDRVTGLPEVKVFAGVEDLPYFHTFLSTPYRIPPNEPYLNGNITDPNSLTQNAQRDSIDCWLQFVLWKPNQQLQIIPTVVPSGFRILFTGSDIHMTYYGNGDTDSTPPVEYPANSQILYHPRDTVPHLSDQANVLFIDTPTDFRVPTLLGGLSSLTRQHGFQASMDEGNGKNPRGNAPTPRGLWLGETYRPERPYAAPPAAPAPVYTHTEFRCVADALLALPRFELQYRDGTGVYRTYQRYDRFGVGTGNYIRGRGTFGYADNPYGLGQAGAPGFNTGIPYYKEVDIATLAMSAVDPRSQRYGLLAHYLDEVSPSFLTPSMQPVDWHYYLKNGWSPKPNNYTPFSMGFGPASSNGRFTPSWSGGNRQNPWAGHTADTVTMDPAKFWADNAASTAGTNGYKDMDLVSRRVDGDLTNTVRPMNLASATAPNSSDLSRVLNRPFRNVGELGYVFRDEPYKSLNLFTSTSADSALLDLFSVNEQPAIVAGKVNLNTKVPEVLQAVIVGASRDEGVSSPNYLSTAEALTIATALRDNVKDTSGAINTGPLLNPSEIANRLATILPVANSQNQAIKTRREVVGRALAGSGQTRTWNFLVDVIAQSGRYAPNAATAQQFVVEGERRYWLHVAIDRYTGQVIDQQLELVME